MKKTIKILPVKRNILSVKKYKMSAREKKVGVKKTEKSLREKALPPVKKPKKTSKLVFINEFFVNNEQGN